jgi:hypothetical protein
MCGKISTVEVKEYDLNRWRDGGMIQTVFPYLSASEREKLITGYCDMCWDRMFKGSKE